MKCVLYLACETFQHKNSTLKFFVYFLLLLALSPIHSQEQINWVPPLTIPIQLSGTFGELRNTHFHAGLDIRTQGRQGLPVNSVQDGWISRINVSTSGYGKALYIDHLDGTTTVYAHLKKFSPRIEAYVKENQYEKESYTLRLFPKKDELPISLGEEIGFSGNTGGSYGPHLHFEVRNTRDQTPINAMQYPFEIEDTQRPQIQNFYLYENTTQQSRKKEFRLTPLNDSVYSTPTLSALGKINVGLRLFDRQNLSYNKNGIYKATIRLNGKVYFDSRMDQMSFNDSKYIDLLVDYSTLKKDKIRIQRFVKHPSQKLSFLGDTENGEMEISTGNSYQLLVTVEDFNGNKRYIESYIEGGKALFDSIAPLKSSYNPTIDHFFDFEQAAVYFPKDCFFEPVALNIAEKGNVIHVDEDRYPLQKPFEVRFKIEDLDSLSKAQSFIARLSANGKPLFMSTKKGEKEWTAKSSSLGKFTLSKDSLAPTLKAVNFKSGQWLTNYSFLKFKIADDLTGIKNYRGEINGRWIRLEYEPKNQSLIYDFSDLEFNQAEHQLTLEAEDGVGNKQRLEMTFYRKPKTQS